jgi:hypothetical protein
MPATLPASLNHPSLGHSLFSHKVLVFLSLRMCCSSQRSRALCGVRKCSFPIFRLFSCAAFSAEHAIGEPGASLVTASEREGGFGSSTFNLAFHAAALLPIAIELPHLLTAQGSTEPSGFGKAHDLLPSTLNTRHPALDVAVQQPALG